MKILQLLSITDLHGFPGTENLLLFLCHNNFHYCVQVERFLVIDLPLNSSTTDSPCSSDVPAIFSLGLQPTFSSSSCRRRTLQAVLSFCVQPLRPGCGISRASSPSVSTFTGKTSELCHNYGAYTRGLNRLFSPLAHRLLLFSYTHKKSTIPLRQWSVVVGVGPQAPSSRNLNASFPGSFLFFLVSRLEAGLKVGS